jgi:DNA-binding LacI/PurR family transcriptional regulator
MARVAMAATPCPPTALIGGGHGLLQDVLRAVQAQGCAVGRAPAVVGAADRELRQCYRPPITSSKRDLDVRGETAVQLLIATIQQGSSRVVTLLSALIVRESLTLWQRAVAR